MPSQRNHRSIQVGQQPKHSNIFQNDSGWNLPYLLACKSGELYPNLREDCQQPCARILLLQQDMLLYKLQKLHSILAQQKLLVLLLCGSVTKHQQEFQMVRIPISRNRELLSLHRYPKQHRENCKNCACWENRNQ